MPSLRPYGLILLAALAGCSSASLRSSLVGEWRGTPESSAARGEREQSRLVGLQQAAGIEEEGAAEEPLAHPPTDLEQFEFEIWMNLAPDGSTRMSLADGAEERTGTWRVVAPDLNGATLEFALPEGGDEPVRRRFELRFTNSDQTEFTLREEGADPRFGRISFKRGEKRK